MRKGQLLTQCLVKYKVSALFVFLSLTVFVNVLSNFLLSSIINILLLSDCSLSGSFYITYAGRKSFKQSVRNTFKLFLLKLRDVIFLYHICWQKIIQTEC